MRGLFGPCDPLCESYEMLEISIEDERWTEVAFTALAERAAQVVLNARSLDPDECEISVLACDDIRIAELNAEFRGKETPTNVLSWPAEDLSAEEEGGEPEAPEPDFAGEICLGDIAVSYDTCLREAEEAGKTFDDHVTHLMVHGLLHLLGYDHIRDGDATRMEALEVEILSGMGISDPYLLPDPDDD
jgi:probable rRNA maturation factor